ncbi:MAG: glycosyltransferase family 4 protein [Anaerolineales bacterium]|nr:glycosyltransferase family 4 protein [Anaerolineales bacterium]
MKIALLSEKYTPDIGGLAISTERLAHLLTSAGHQIRLFVPTSNLPASETHTLNSNGVKVTRFGAHKRVDNTLVDWFELIVAEHEKESFDLIQAYFLPQAGFVATYAGKYLNIPSVVSIRGNDIERATFDPSKFSHVMYALQNANAVTTNASVLIKKAKAFFDREIILIPNGIDTNHFKPMKRNDLLASHVILSEAKDLGDNRRDSSVGAKHLPQSDTLSVIGFVGELRGKKGLQTLLLAYAQVNKKQPVTLLIVGEVRQGEDKKFFDEFQTTNPDSRIIVTGHIPHKDLPAYYSLIDAFVHPSLRDGMPNAVLEAMACGKTVIATPVGGVVDVIEDGKNGYFVNVNDVDGLSNKMLEVLNSNQETIQKSARETIINQFTLEKELNANLSVYKKLGVNL